jgi:predicted  nucleic acid-binding Zn-ribbon protein
MNASIQALLELQVIDRQRLTLRAAREAKLKKKAAGEKAYADADHAANLAQAEVDRQAALDRQYRQDVERCERTVVELRAKQPEAKTNSDYMALMNGIEQAKLEKVKRESSLKDLVKRIAELQTKADAVRAKAERVKALADAAAADATEALVPTPEEAALQAQYDERRTEVLPAFLEHYERLVKANHKSPLMRVDASSRATPLGAVLSHHQMEQIRSGVLVLDRNNAILYLP